MIDAIAHALIDVLFALGSFLIDSFLVGMGLLFIFALPFMFMFVLAIIITIPTIILNELA